MRRSLSSAQRHDVAVVDALFEFAPAFNALMEAGLAARGLSLSRATLLWELAARGPAIQRELADALGVVPRTVTGMVDELAARKLVERVPHPHDRRVCIVTLTERGKALIAVLRAERDAFASELLAGVADADVQTTRSVLAALTERLRRIADPTTKEDRP
jgi:DNA-binding MarR family transcriptional regulator